MERLKCSLVLMCTCGQGSRVADLQSQAVELREEIKVNPGNYTKHVALGIVLQELNILRPDGGLGIPEAENAYR